MAGPSRAGDSPPGFFVCVRTCTLIGNCHREGIDATAYLTDICKRLPTETKQTVHRLTPKAWAAEQAVMRQALAQAVMMPV